VTDPDDLVGEVFLQVVRNLDTFTGDEAGFRSWLFTIVHRRVLDARRRARRRPEELDGVRPADREGTEFPGNGRALGRGHSDAVHAILAADGSPSELPPHSEAVSALASAYEKVKANHPGQGEGLEKEKPARGADDGNEAESDDD
jgi:RNA polymerase sigma factor (sigma-70 family)